jgi:hypothetical protein
MMNCGSSLYYLCVDAFCWCGHTESNTTSSSPNRVHETDLDPQMIVKVALNAN